MIRLKFLLILFLVYSGTFAQVKDAIISIKNPDNDTDRVDEVLEMKWSEIIGKFPYLKPGDFKIIDVKTGKELPFQLTYEGGAEVKDMLVQLSVSAGSLAQIAIQKGKPAIFKSKVYGRFVPERKDDFAWENDKVAFRMYGKALEGTNENAYGIDVWAKRTEELIIDKWYKSGDYHRDHGDGLDYYSVGLTLGGGDIAPFIKDQIVFPKNYRTWKVLDKGPLRFSFELGYDEWQVGDTRVKVVKQISLDAGSQMNKVEAIFTYADKDKPLEAVIGIAKRKEAGTINIDESGNVVGYWEPEHGNDGTIGVGSIVSGKTERMLVNKDHILTLVKVENDVPLVYYNGAAWSKAGKINNAKEWFQYLDTYRVKLKTPLIISYN